MATDALLQELLGWISMVEGVKNAGTPVGFLLRDFQVQAPGVGLCVAEEDLALNLHPAHTC